MAETLTERPEREMVRRALVPALVALALATALAGVLGGPGAAASAAIGIVIVYLNFAANGLSLAWASTISVVAVQAVALRRLRGPPRGDRRRDVRPEHPRLVLAGRVRAHGGTRHDAAPRATRRGSRSAGSAAPCRSPPIRRRLVRAPPWPLGRLAKRCSPSHTPSPTSAGRRMASRLPAPRSSTTRSSA